MIGKIIIDAERCKGCGLCVIVCPKDSITISVQSNKMGYFPAEAKNTDCTGCTMCAIICPEAAIIVLRDNRIEEVQAGRNKSSKLTEEKV